MGHGVSPAPVGPNRISLRSCSALQHLLIMIKQSSCRELKNGHCHLERLEKTVVQFNIRLEKV